MYDACNDQKLNSILLLIFALFLDWRMVMASLIQRQWSDVDNPPGNLTMARMVPGQTYIVISNHAFLWVSKGIWKVKSCGECPMFFQGFRVRFSPAKSKLDDLCPTGLWFEPPHHQLLRSAFRRGSTRSTGPTLTNWASPNGRFTLKSTQRLMCMLWYIIVFWCLRWSLPASLLLSGYINWGFAVTRVTIGRWATRTSIQWDLVWVCLTPHCLAAMAAEACDTQSLRPAWSDLPMISN